LAAAVWAWTYEGKAGRPSKSVEKSTDSRYTITAFAGLGIRGLRSKDSVIKYRRIWQSAIDAGEATEVKPGDTITEPKVPFGLIGEDGPEKAPESSAEPRSARGRASGTGEQSSEPQEPAQAPTEPELPPADLSRIDKSRFHQFDPAVMQLGQKVCDVIEFIETIRHKLRHDPEAADYLLEEIQEAVEHERGKLRNEQASEQ